MSVEYTLRMDVMRSKREEFTSRRVAIEKKIALREATAAEFSAVARQSYATKWKRARATAVSAKARNDEFIKSLHAMQQRAHEALVRQRNDLTASSALLEREKARYAQKIEAVYPAWQERQQAARLRTLRALEEKKRAVEKRRYLAKKTFEKEQSLDDLIRQTSHEIELAESLEQNEVYERELLRRQSAAQSARLDHTIREHALGARTYMAQQGHEHIREAAEIDERVTDTLFEAFSPRGALQALQHANRSLSFDERPQQESAPAQRSLKIEIPRAFVQPSASFERVQQQQQVMLHRQPSVHVDATCSSQLLDFSRVSSESNQLQHFAASTAAPVVAVDSQLRLGPNRELQAMNQESVSRLNGERDTAPSSRATVSVFLSQSAIGASTATPLSSTKHYLPTSSTASWLQSTASSVPLGQSTQQVDVEPSVMAATSLAATMPGTRPLGATAAVAGAASAAPLATTTPIEQQTAPLTTAEHVATLAAASKLELSAPAKTNLHSPPSASERSASAPQAFNRAQLLLSAPTPSAESQQMNATLDTKSDSSAPERLDSDVRTVLDSMRLEHKQTDERDETPTSADLRSNEPGVSTVSPTFASTVSSFSGLSDSMAILGELSASRSAVSPIGAGELERKVDLTLDLITSLDSSASQFAASSLDHLASVLQNIADTESVHKLKDETKKGGVTSAEQSLPLASQQPAGIDDDRPMSMSATLPDESSSSPAEKSSCEESSLGFSDSPRLQATKSGRELKESRAPALEGDLSVVGAFTVESTSSVEVSMPTTRDDSTPADSLDARIDTFVPDVSSDSVGLRSELKRGALLSTQSGGVQSTSEPSQSSEQVLTVTAAAASVSSDPKSIEEKKQSPIERLSMVDKAKVLTALIARVEAGANEGDQFSAPGGDDSASTAASDSKRELVRMAVGDRKAQINFFGSDICFELVLDVARDVGPVLFPSRAFEGIMNEQKIRKVHQHSKNKELELWRLLSTHMKQMVTLKALSVSAIAELFGGAFLHHDPANQRSLRKARLCMNELLHNVCGAKASSVSPKKDSAAAASPSPSQAFSQLMQSQRGGSGGKGDGVDDDEFESSRPDNASKQSHLLQQPSTLPPRSEATSLLQTAFLQHQSPPKPKTFGLASSGYKKKSDAQDVLQSMTLSPTKLSHKLLRGGKINDYSEFEDEEGVDLQNLIGSRSSGMTRAGGGGSTASMASPSPSIGGSVKASTRTGGAPASMSVTRAAKDADDFDVDF